MKEKKNYSLDKETKEIIDEIIEKEQTREKDKEGKKNSKRKGKIIYKNVVGLGDKQYGKKKNKDKKNKFEFKYYSKKKFKELQENENVEIVGHFSTDKEFKDNANAILRIKNKSFDVIQKDKGRTVGYVLVKEVKKKEEKVEQIIEDVNKDLAKEVSDNLDVEDCTSSEISKEAYSLKNEEDPLSPQVLKFVRFYKKSLYPFVLLLLLFGLLLGGIWFNADKIADKLGIDLEDGKDWDGENKKNDSKQITDTTQIPGFVDLEITKDDPILQLGNPKGNTVYFEYIIIDKKENKVIYKTNGIKPGMAVEWNPYDHLKKGTYELGVNINTYDLETARGCNGAKQKMKLTLK